MEGIGLAIFNARAVLNDGEATVQSISEAIGALAAAGALCKPEGQRIMAELSAKLAGIGRANSLNRWKMEAEQMTARHAAERSQLVARARAEIPDTGERELFPRASAKSAESDSSESVSKVGLPDGLYRHTDGREYRQDGSKPGRRPDWLSTKYWVCE